MDYIPQGYDASSDGMKKLDADVKEANKAYNHAEQKEDEIVAQFARYQGIKAGVFPSTSDDDEMLAASSEAANTDNEAEKMEEAPPSA